MTQGDQFLIKVEQFSVLLRFIPFHTPAASRIMFAVHANLVSVIDARRAHVTELE
ncbi:hypothetical protein D3C76_1737970 [compost metagenome]